MRPAAMDARMQFPLVQINEPKIEDVLVGPISLADLVRKAVQDAGSFKQECADVSKKVETLGKLLRQAARFASTNPAGLYESPTRRIAVNVEKTLEKAFALVRKCKRSGSGMVKRLITITNVSDFRRLNQHLENSIVDVRWLLNISATGDDRPDFTGLPPIAATEPILAMVWEYISIVHVGSPEERAQCASSLADLAKESRNAKIIVEEGGVQPLLRLLREGNKAGQEDAARALGCLAADPESVRRMRMEGAISAFAQILGHGSMKVQAMVAWALSEFCDKDKESQNECAAAGGIRLLVYLLAHDTIEDSMKMSKPSSIHTVVMSMGHNSYGGEAAVAKPSSDPATANPIERRSASEKWIGASENGGRMHSFPASLRNDSKSIRDNEDPETKLKLKAEVARALWKVAKDNVANSKSITDTRALLCFAKLIETAKGEVLFNSVMAVTVITAAAEEDEDLRRAAFRTNSPAAKAVVDQLLRVIESGEPELQEPCLKSIGSLARIFSAPAVRIIGPITKALGGVDARVAEQAAIALYKFAYPKNYLHIAHSKTILELNGAMLLVLWLGATDIYTQKEVLLLLCCLSVNVPDHDALAQAMVLQRLETLSRTPAVTQNLDARVAVADAISKLEVYQASVHRPHNMVAPYES